MTKIRVASAPIASLILAFPTLILISWATSAQAHYPITGNIRFQIGHGLPIPVTLAPPPQGGIGAVPGATIIQASTGPDPRTLTIPVGAFTHPGTPRVMLPLFGANNNIWQIMTGINVTLPATPMEPGKPLLNVLRASGRTGPPNVTWCPGQPVPNVTYNPNCTDPANPAHPTGGRLRYQKTANQFGGPISYEVGGIVDRALRLSGAPPPCRYSTTTCQAYFAIGPPLQTGAIGGPFGQVPYRSSGPPPSPGHFNIVAATKGTIIGITPTGLGRGLSNPVSSWGGPWTTGQIMISVFGSTYFPYSCFTLTGSDNRVSGVGNISLVSGAISVSGLSGTQAGRGWLNITVPEPAAAVGATAAFLLLATCHILVRRRSR